MLLFILSILLSALSSILNSNTSHVIVYPEHAFRLRDCPEEFKYISCYCLSNILIGRYGQPEHSNTSHVIVYLTGQSGNAPLKINSNTSHVIVYHDPVRHYHASHSIQIHLMLLFITWRRSRKVRGKGIQIHLMLLFIGEQ